MRNFFENIKLDTNDFDSQIYLFILYLQDIICDSKKYTLILNYYSHKFCNNKKNTDYDFFKIENNKLYIYNQYEKIQININDYVPENIYIEFISNQKNLPLEILLQRNISFDYFNNHKKTINCINDNELYKDFKEYFKLFINSKLIKDVLDKFDPNLKNLIESNIFKGNELDEEFVKTLPLISEKIQGITNKDLAISFISSSPFILDNWDFPKNLDEYKTIKNLHYIINIGGKFVIIIHEIIHLNYAYLFYLTEKKISINSLRLQKTNKNSIKDDNDPENDGGSFFEKKLFGRKLKSLNFQNVLVLLDENNLEKSISEFRNEFNSTFNLVKFEKRRKEKKFGKFLTKILDKYPLNIKDPNIEKIYLKMRTRENGEISIEFGTGKDCFTIRDILEK